MGCYDSVYAECPKCKDLIEFQSKSGPCELKRYKADYVPLAVVSGLSDFTEKCKNCNTEVRLRPTQERVALQPQVVIEYKEEDEWD